MPKLLYISLMRLPTEKAHGLQIMQNCEAFADAGYDVTLWVARRWNTAEMRRAADPFAFYGVDPVFSVSRLPCLDLFPLFPKGVNDRLAFYMLMMTYALALLLRLPFVNADIYYSRDEFLLWLLRFFKPKASLAYEAHLFPSSERGAKLQRAVCQNVGSVIAITPQLRDDLIKHRGADSSRVITAHDGIRQARFKDLPDSRVARRRIGWDENAFIVGFVGRLSMIGMDKGLGGLVASIAAVDGAHLALVGGPAEMAEQLRIRWRERGLDESRFLYAGQAPAADVPFYLAAFDVALMPHPATPQFARYTSPLKLFEYMAAGKAIAASDLPGWSDVVVNEENALLLPPGDAKAWTDALCRLRDDPALRARLGQNAREKALAHYTWSVRAQDILSHIQSA